MDKITEKGIKLEEIELEVMEVVVLVIELEVLENGVSLFFNELILEDWLFKIVGVCISFFFLCFYEDV